MILPGTYHNGFAPRDGEPLFPELWRGCVGAWNPGLGPSGLRLYDWSPYKNHGTLTNMDAGTDWVASQGRYALDFDGSNDFARFSLNYPQTTTQPFSAFAWVVGMPSFTRWQRLISGGWILLDIDISGTRRLGFGYISSAGGGRWGYSSEIYDATRLNLFVGTSDGTNTLGGLKMYLNGAQLSQVAVDNASITIEASAFLQYGGTDGSAAYAASKMHQCGLYDRVLSPNEIRLLASRPGIAYEMIPSQLTGSEALIAAYRARQYSQIIGGGVI